MSSKVPEVRPCLLFITGVAQLARATYLRFPVTEMDSRFFLACNPWVAGSSPAAGSILRVSVMVAR